MPATDPFQAPDLTDFPADFPDEEEFSTPPPAAPRSGGRPRGRTGHGRTGRTGGNGRNGRNGS